MCSILSGKKKYFSLLHTGCSVLHGEQIFTRVAVELRLQISGAIRPLAHILHDVLLK